MKKHLFFISAMLLIQAVSASAFAQVAGDTISGILSGKDGPLKMVRVTERNANDSVVSFGITDFEGKFSFRLVNNMDRLYISYKGYETVDIPITRLHYELKMKESGHLPGVVYYDGGLGADKPIPLRETRETKDTIDISAFEFLGFTTIDEILNAEMGLDLPW